ncbi:hypothetical protein CP985_08180 [Malaciobacter mytili LMG 24559]|uniref:Beta-ketoacyl synthase N-terminal domain-containing protein n=1 Tax=Malaciobacter mytili LMG 24559 TaxID=1032238 RepID=A0AAX2AFS1_9BACT|nr:hypothetical protein [Malaciobacter mytili]AXH13847.1 hypothetical protein AMYT_0228 [Malaciobacter mytili LMG 24559]RXK15500.1 hypothetical protein CP985_08180 [Malaciobacter mytili LMG 24559]
MYIHSISNILNSNKQIKEYRDELKKLSSINLRRSSKFNILAVYGALLCTKDISLEDNIGIYVATESGPISDVDKVLSIVNEPNNMIMPFDFLNINTNNVSFYVSKAINANGKNMVITSKNFSFEKALQLSKFDLEINEVTNVLVGAVDESLENIKEYKTYLPEFFNKNPKDGSLWLYANNNPVNALAKIDDICEYSNFLEFKNSFNLKNSIISLNFHALFDEELKNFLKDNKLLSSDDFFGCDGALSFFELLKHKGKLAHIAKDINNKFIVIYITI